MAWNRISKLAKNDRILDTRMYTNIFRDHLPESGSNLMSGDTFWIQQESNFIHMTQITKEHLYKVPRVFQTPFQSPDFN